MFHAGVRTVHMGNICGKTIAGTVVSALPMRAYVRRSLKIRGKKILIGKGDDQMGLNNPSMTEEKITEFHKMLDTVPERHPFEPAKLCRTYCYDNTPTYVTSPAYDAFTYPSYDAQSRSFLYRHYDMEAETEDDVSIDLVDFLEPFIGYNFEVAVKICNLFNVPMLDIKSCTEEIQKIRREESESKTGDIAKAGESS